MAEPIDYKKRCEEYERRMGIGERNPSKDSYLVLVEIQRQQNEYLKTVKIKNMIGTEEKGKASEYERAKALWEKLPSFADSVDDLKIKLKMDGEEKKETYKPVSARSIAEDEEEED
jgi:hypothetical protein